MRKLPRLRLKSKSAPGIKLYAALAVLACAVIVVDALIIVNYQLTQRKRSQFIATQVSKLGSKNVPSASKPTAKQLNDYQVPPSMPKYLVIPSINVDARVVQLGTNPQDQVDAPDNIYDVGWYTGSSLPGQSGAVFIDGHVSSWTANGVFYNLDKLKPGDTIRLVRGDNAAFNYVVDKLQVYGANNVNMQQALSPTKPNGYGLNLMTCTGEVIKGTSEFNERLVVYSTLQN